MTATPAARRRCASRCCLPITDGAMDTPSYAENGDGYYLTRAGMGWYWGHYLAGADPLHPDASPLRAADLGGLPPA